MKRPLWFRRQGLRWAPCAWQGWAIVGGFTVFLIVFLPSQAPKAPIPATLVTVCATALLIGIAAWTDDTHRSAP